MALSNLAVSVITFNRSHLLDLCLSSIQNAMEYTKYPVYVFVQDLRHEDELVLSKYCNLISKVVSIQGSGKDVEELINANRYLAWKDSLIDENHDYSICLEDDVEISHDFFRFTEGVLELNKDEDNFRGINYGSFETTVKNGGFSRIRYGIHGPASLITRKSFQKFEMDKLVRLKGKIAWDSWVEPITKMGFMATSNIAKYRDNGIYGTHSSSESGSEYFTRLGESFQFGVQNPCVEIYVEDIPHSWRRDCVSYSSRDDFKFLCQKIVIRAYQYFNSIFRKKLTST